MNTNLKVQSMINNKMITSLLCVEVTIDINPLNPSDFL